MLIALAVGLALYALLVGWLVINEDRLVYFPEQGPVPLPRGIGVNPVSLDAADGVRLSAWVLAPMSDASRWILVLHGNAGNLATPGRPEHDSQLWHLGLGVFALDYRGYGDSQGMPSESGLYADALAAWQYLTTVRQVPPGRIVIYGHSLGAAVAVQLATRVPAAALIIEGAFTSAPDRGAELYPFIPVRLIARNRFPSLDRIRNLKMPLLVIHGRDDTTIPIAHGRRLFDAAPEPKSFLEVAGGHDDAYVVGASEYEEGITRFLATLH
ncbi:MAG TPA: alpha/beta hydrolase [Gemmatimonadales bacterium]|nr:alpha/beta hydrolase [Gemmatimonadales bacterium]